MNLKELVRRTAAVMRDNNTRKSVSSPKKVFHISDDEGNSRDFIVKKSNKEVLFTAEDIDLMLEACGCVIKEALKQGESVSIHGFGTLSLRRRKARVTKHPRTGEPVDVEARYVPKFTFGNGLRMCAKLYEISITEGAMDYELQPDKDFEGDGD